METKIVRIFWALAISALPAAQLGVKGATVITQWNFDGGTTNPSIGTGTLLSVGGIKETPVDGNTALNTSVYPPQSTRNKAAGLQFDVSTAGKQKILISWQERVSPTASKYGRLQYTTNGIDFLDFPTPIVMGSVDTFESKSCDFSQFPGVNNNSNFSFKIVTEFESTAVGGTNASYVTASGNDYTTVGTVRFDLVTVSGESASSNRPPQSSPSVANVFTVIIGTTLFITNVATDPDIPPQKLTFSLGPGAEKNASIDATTGVFSWTPTLAQTGFYSFTVIVTDDGSPPLSATQTFSVLSNGEFFQMLLLTSPVVYAN